MQLVAEATAGPRGLLWLAPLLLAVAAQASEAPPEVGPPRTEGAPGRVADPAPDPLREWSGTGAIEERAERARLAALRVGIPSFDAPARGLLLFEDPAGSGLEQAREATAVAPELPMARAALAKALLGEFHVGEALGAGIAAVAALPEHPEARAWFEATASFAAGRAIFFGALVFLALVCLRHGLPAAHDLGDGISSALPLFARTGLLGLLLLVPAILGQGLLGFGLAAVALATLRGSPRERAAGLVAGALLALGVQGGSLATARALVAFEPDAVAAAALAVERGSFASSDLLVLERARGADPLATRALAVAARRRGDLLEAADGYGALLEAGLGDAALANNAGNVSMALGHVESAVALYQLADELGGGPEVLYNLSFGYGEAIRPSLQDETLRRLQHEHPALATALLDLQAKLTGGFTIDLPLPEALLRTRPTTAEAVAATARAIERPLAPGALGESPGLYAGVLATVAVVGSVLARARHSSACRHCGARLCPRCDAPSPARDLCTACHRLLRNPESADPERRSQRLAELANLAEHRRRAYLVAAFAVPGAAGVFAGRPWLGLGGALAGCGAIALLGAPGTLVPDPLAVGAAGPLAFGAAALSCVAIYAVILTIILGKRSGEVGA